MQTFKEGDKVHVFANGLYEGEYYADIFIPGLTFEQLCLIKLNTGGLGVFRKVSLRHTRVLPHLVSSKA